MSNPSRFKRRKLTKRHVETYPREVKKNSTTIKNDGWLILLTFLLFVLFVICFSVYIKFIRH